MQILVLINGQQNGPYSPEEVRQYLASGQLQPQMQAWREGMKDWQPLETFPEFAAVAASTGRGAKRSRAGLYASLALGAVALCAVAGWWVWHGKRSSGSAAATAEGTATAATTSTVGGPKWPKTLAELNQWYAQPPPGQNAAEFFLQGCDAMKEQMQTHAYDKNVNLPVIGKPSIPEPDSPVPGAMETAIAEFMQENQPAWDLFERGSSMTQSRYPIDMTKGSETQLPHLARLKQAAQLSQVFALGYADTGRGKEAGESLFIGYAIGQSVEAEPILISQLVRVACDAITFAALGQIANRVAVPPETLTRLQEVLGGMADREAGGENFNRAFVGEKLIGLSHFDITPKELQQFLASNSGGSPGDDKDGIMAGLRQDGLKNVKADRRFFADSCDQYLAARKEPFPARLKADDMIKQRYAEAVKKRFWMSAMVLNSGGLTVREARGLALLRLAQTAVGLERFRAASGKGYPDDLAELTPKFLASVPQDPFDGQPLRYAKSGNGYSLNSIGPAGAAPNLLKALMITVSNPPKSGSAGP